MAALAYYIISALSGLGASIYLFERLKRHAKNKKKSDVVRGAITEISNSVWEDPDEWFREDENKITNKHSNISIWIGDGEDNVHVTGTISVEELWREERKMLWAAAQFFESERIKEMLRAPPISFSEEDKTDFFRSGQKIGRKFVFNEEGKVVPYRTKKR